MSPKSKLMQCGWRILGFALATLVLFDGGVVNTPFLQVHGRHTLDVSRLIHHRQSLSRSIALQTIRGGGPFNNKNPGMETNDQDTLLGEDPTELEEEIVVISFQEAGETSQIPEEERTSNEINLDEHGGNHALNNDQDAEEGVPSQSVSTSTTQAAGSVFSSPKWQNFQQRTIPAILLLGAVGAWSYFLKEDGMILLVLFAQVGMYKEATSVLSGVGNTNSAANVWNKWWWFMTFSIAVNGPRVFSWATTTLSSIASAMAVAGVIGNILVFNGNKSSGGETNAVDNFQKYLQEAAISHLALLLVVAPSSFWIAILEDYGMVWVIYAAALVMINDTMAYVFGMTFGKHALLPQISPKKTWEGFLGAAASTVLASLYIIPRNDGAAGITKLQDALLLSMYASLIAPFGGFLASVIKRAYGKKDFGTLIPGHGGLVDRFDCQLIMAPFVYLYLQHTRQRTPT